MKKVLIFVLLIFACTCAFAKNSSVGAYVSLYSVQSSKGLADTSKCASKYGFGGKADYNFTFYSRMFGWTVGADLDINDYFYKNKAHGNDFTAALFVTGGINLIDTEKGIVSFGLGLGPHINAVGGDSSTNLAMMFKGTGTLHMYNNISLSAQLEGVVAFMGKNRSSFEFKTFAGVKRAF